MVPDWNVTFGTYPRVQDTSLILVHPWINNQTIEYPIFSILLKTFRDFCYVLFHYDILKTLTFYPIGYNRFITQIFF